MTGVRATREYIPVFNADCSIAKLQTIAAMRKAIMEIHEIVERTRIMSCASHETILRADDLLNR
jgi:hypothetical protein